MGSLIPLFDSASARTHASSHQLNTLVLAPRSTHKARVTASFERRPGKSQTQTRTCTDTYTHLHKHPHTRRPPSRKKFHFLCWAPKAR